MAALNATARVNGLADLGTRVDLVGPRFVAEKATRSSPRPLGGMPRAGGSECQKRAWPDTTNSLCNNGQVLVQ